MNRKRGFLRGISPLWRGFESYPARWERTPDGFGDSLTANRKRKQKTPMFSCPFGVDVLAGFAGWGRLKLITSLFCTSHISGIA